MNYPFLFKKIGVVEPDILRTAPDRSFIEEYFPDLEPEGPVEFAAAGNLSRFRQAEGLEAFLYHMVYVPLREDLRFEWYHGQKLYDCVARRGEMLLCNDIVPFRVSPAVSPGGPRSPEAADEEPVAAIFRLIDPGSRPYLAALKMHELKVVKDLDERIRRQLDRGEA